MSHQQHDLASELPEFRDKIHSLKVENGHFRRLLEEYNDLDQRIWKIEGDGQPISDQEFEDLKKRRLALKDELIGMLKG